MKTICYNCLHPQEVDWCEKNCQLLEALKMAIIALKQPEDEDIISRQSALQAIEDCSEPLFSHGKIWRSDARNRLEKLPPISEPMYYPQVDGITPSVIIQSDKNININATYMYQPKDDSSVVPDPPTSGSVISQMKGE